MHKEAFTNDVSLTGGGRDLKKTDVSFLQKIIKEKTSVVCNLKAQAFLFFLKHNW